MLATKVTRVAQRLPSAAPITAATCSPYLAGSVSRPSHQRRRSSSKASCPPDNSSKPALKPAASPPTVATSTRTKRTAKSRRVTQEKTIEHDTKYDTLPSVPQLHHFGEQDFGLSSFFALHRPLSVTTPLPAAVSGETFNAIFDSASLDDPWAAGNSAEKRPEDVVFALAKTIEAIEEASSAAQNDILRADITQESSSNADATKHLDGLPQLKLPTLEEIIAHAKPYQVPPPPQAFPTETTAVEKKAVRMSKGTPRTKSYTTTITVVESEHANGEKTYEASASPIVRLPDSSAQAPWTPYRSRKMDKTAASYSIRRTSIREPHARRRVQPTSRLRKPHMLLISVRRQRKLKMKKHKLKKLMRRTRTLRRKLENK